MWRYAAAMTIICIGVVAGVYINDYQGPRSDRYSLEVISETKQNQANIEKELNTLIHIIPGVHQARFSIIHGSGRIDKNNIDRFEVDIVANVAAPGYTAGKILKNIPLSQWYDFLPVLLANKCTIMDFASISEDALKDRLNQPGHGKKFMGCPVRSTNGDLRGAVFVAWSSAPSQDDINIAYDQLRTAAFDISKMLTSSQPK